MSLTRLLKTAREQPLISTILAALAKPVHHVGQRIASQLERKIKKNGIALQLPNGRTMRIGRNAGVSIASALFWSGLNGHEPYTSRTLQFFFERASVFVDVGANYGFYSILAGLSNPSLRVIAFEPVPQIHNALVNNLASNQIADRVVAHRMALSDQTGQATFYLPEAESVDLESTGTLVEDGWQSRKHSPMIQVETIRFDDYEKANPTRVDLIKIDVEDAESSVLEGMRQTISRDRPFVVCEILQRQHANQKTREMVQALGYTPYWITSSGYIRVSRFDFPRSSSQDFLLSPVAGQGEVIADLTSLWTAREFAEKRDSHPDVFCVGLGKLEPLCRELAAHRDALDLIFQVDNPRGERHTSGRSVLVSRVEFRVGRAAEAERFKC